MLGLILSVLVSTLMLSTASYGDGALNKTVQLPMPELLPLEREFDDILAEIEEEEEPILDDGGVMATPDEVDDGVEVPALVQPSANISYVPMPMPEKPRQVSLYVQGTAPGHVKTIRNISHKMKSFYERQSRRKIFITPTSGLKDLRARGPNRFKLIFKPGANSHVPIIGNAMSATHEFGHQLGLDHANTRLWETQTKVKQARRSRDPFDVMVSAGGSGALNAPHMHLSGWFNPTEEAYLEEGVEYTLSIINAGGKDFKSLKALYYEVPGSTKRVWLSYGRVKSKGWHAPEGMPRTAVVVHSAGGRTSTFFEGLIGLQPETLIRYGLIVNVTEPTAHTVKVKVTKIPNWVSEE